MNRKQRRAASKTRQRPAPRRQAPPSAEAKLQTALSHHQAGRLAQAGAIYQDILSDLPGQVDALYLLGVVKLQEGDAGAAVELSGKAIANKPDFAEAHNNLGNAYKDRGRLDEAVAAFRKAVELKPDFAEAHNNLGIALKDRGKLDDVVAAFRKAVELKPDFAEAHNNLGNALKDQGKADDAEAAYRKALELKPDYAMAHNNLGNVLEIQGKGDDAEAAYRKALELKPDDAMAYNNLGVLLGERGNPVDAEAVIRKALALKPDYAMAHNNLGNVLEIQGKLEDAMAAYRKAVSLKPDYAEAYNNLGIVLKIRGHCVDAEAAYRTALELKPDYALAYSNLGNALKSQGRLEDAMASYRKALELDPGFASAHGNLLLSLNYDDRISQKDIFDESRRWDEAHGAPRSGRRRSHANSRDAERRLRIGYVSPDFREHSVSYFLGPLIAGHDRSRFEVFCYAEVTHPDDTTARYRGLADGWHSTVGEKDPAIAARIQEDGIDILVDLAGHTADNRQLVFAARPAPVQVAWLGYPNTTGQSAMDYRISDAIADPEAPGDALYSETLVRLAGGFLCYGPPADAPEIAGSPALDGGHVTFGSFNNLSKVTPPVVAAWARILDAVPGSRLLIKSRPLADEETRARYLEMFAAHGTDTGRVELLSWIPSKSGHLGAYGRVDIGLDPFPYNGTTTTCEAMWMGVPVITLSGDRHAGRVGASILTRVGLTEFITGTAAAYVEAAMKLADDRDRLSELRHGLRRRLRGSLLCDGAAFTRDVEAAYRDMWRQWCAGGQASG